MGRRGEAQKTLGELKEMSKRRYVSPMNIAWVYIGLNERDRAFEWLEKAYAEQARGLGGLKRDLIYDLLRSDPRFQDLLRRMNFPE